MVSMRIINGQYVQLLVPFQFLTVYNLGQLPCTVVPHHRNYLWSCDLHKFIAIRVSTVDQYCGSIHERTEVQFGPSLMLEFSPNLVLRLMKGYVLT